MMWSVRRRMVMGLLVMVVVVGVVVFFGSRAEEDSVEYHLKAYHEASKGTRIDGVRAWFQNLFAKGGSYSLAPDEVRRDKHRKALLRLGYLEERSFIVSNRPPNLIAWAVRYECAGLAYQFGTPSGYGDTVRIVGVKEEMPKWEALVRRFDTPEWR